ncbi:TadE/TadG family type IV pilus assembly protein [Mesorhizobium sp. 1M-11]|uniref:TadE/TadG family type IV pilus assembly protein n=1 Tax=Mesorhizobium sp. 1M-11 TaxID=1529006 RepID=UPI0006C745B5|nr:TadE/TadG family type IV pilus assembly protein [Mesorhizobium sp. 1M-11]
MALDKFLGLACRFGRDRHGNFMVMAGVIMGLLALAVGFAVDVGQMMNARSALSNAIDAAVTSTARDLTTGTATEQEATKAIKAFLSANSAGGILASDQIVLDKVELDRTVRTLEVTAHVDVPLYFPLFGSEKTRRVSQTGAAVYSDRKLEVAMMLDVTFSMYGQKLADLKKAANSAAKIFLDGQDAANPRKRLAIIPYSDSVNVGPLAAKSVFAEKYASDRLKTGGNTDAAMLKNQSVGNCATERPGPYQYKEDGPEVSMVHRDYYLDKYAEHYDTDPCPSSEILPLTADLSAAQARIKGLVAVGGTAGHIGIQWTWYMLSEKWGSIMSASQRPAAKNPEKIGKFAILMTDGEFNLSYFDINNYLNAYNNNGKLATREAAKTLCKAMRESGIEIFSVGFHLTETNAKATMKDCASPDSGKTKHYYETSTGPELEKAFEEIARNIEGLALTK